MSLSDAMIGVAHGISLHTDVAGEVPALPGRMFKKIERELVKGKARQRAEKKAVARRMRRFISSHLLTQAEVAPADAMDGVKESPIQAAAPQSELEQPEEFTLPEVKLALLNASRVKKHKGRKAKNSSFSRPPPFNAPSSVQPLPAPPPPPQTPVVVAAPELERKIARLEAALLRRDRSKQQRSDAFNSLKSSEHKKMLQLMDANEHINRLEAKLERVEAEVEEARKKTVTWIHRAEKFKAERYQEYAHLIDPIPPPPHAIEWGTLVRQPEFWGGVVGLVTLLAAVYATSRYMGDKAPAVSFFLCHIIQHSHPTNKITLLTQFLQVPDANILSKAGSVPEAPEG